MGCFRTFNARHAIVTAVTEAAYGTCRKLLPRQGIKGRRTDDTVRFKSMVALIRTDSPFCAGAKNTVYIDIVSGIYQSLLNKEDLIVCRRLGN